MGNRFSEISNAKWCKICSVNVVDGAEHPNEDAHLEAQIAEMNANVKREAMTKKLTATSSLIPVSSNDMLKHIGQVGSPETLCGRLITDKYRPSTTDLVCDICANLAQSTSFLVESEDDLDSLRENASKIVTAMNYTRDGFKIDDDGFTVLTSESEEEGSYPLFSFDRYVVAALEMEEVDADEPVDEIVYLGSVEDDEPIQFTAHWLEEDNEEPLFLPNDEL